MSLTIMLKKQLVKVIWSCRKCAKEFDMELNINYDEWLSELEGGIPPIEKHKMNCPDCRTLCDCTGLEKIKDDFLSNYLTKFLGDYMLDKAKALEILLRATLEGKRLILNEKQVVTGSHIQYEYSFEEGELTKYDDLKFTKERVQRQADELQLIIDDYPALVNDSVMLRCNALHQKLEDIAGTGTGFEASECSDKIQSVIDGIKMCEASNLGKLAIEDLEEIQDMLLDQ